MIDTRNQRGRVAIVNAQQSADAKWLKEAAEVFAKDIMISVDVLAGAFDMKNPDLKGDVTVFIVDDTLLPMSLIAPESKWAVVNVSKIKCDKEPFFKARTMKEVTRAMVSLLGGADSQYPLCLMSVVTNAEGLDKFIDSRLPVDVVERLKKNMPLVGITPFSITTYRAACQQGWAPAPTNEFQKAIWNSVHELPSKPIKIEFDPKRDAGK